MRNGLNTVLVVSVIAALCGCGARRSAIRETRAPETTAEQPVEVFTPSSYIARPTLGLGSKYPDLLSHDSYVIWFSDEVAELKAESAEAQGSISQESEELLRIAKTLNEKYLILECHVVSAFSDSSVGYDVTSFRHADVFLLDDAGNSYEPLQVIIGALERGQKGALMVFRRVNLLVFAKHDPLTGEPVISSDLAEVSLAIKGYNTTYFFSWDNLTRPAREVQVEREVESVRAMSLRKLESALRWLEKNFK